MPMTEREKATAAEKARKIATKAINRAAIVWADPDQTRATRTRAAYKVKAEALDEIALVLTGKK